MARRTPFGPSFDDLTLADVMSALEPGEYEPLTWEAKGIKANAQQVRRHVNGFANSRSGGVLLLGIDQPSKGGAWQSSGVPMSQEPIPEIDQWIRDGLDPVPVYVPRRIGTGELGPIIAINVEPLDVPPCLTRDGQIFERVAGRTIPVASATDLAGLFDRGQAAIARIRDEAHQAVQEAYNLTDPMHGADIVVGIAAASLPSEISGRIFRPSFEEQLRARAVNLHRSTIGRNIQPFVQADIERSQGWIAATARTGIARDESMTLRVRRHGGVTAALDLGEASGDGASWSRGAPDVIVAMHSAIRGVLADLGAEGRTFLVAKQTAGRRGPFEADSESDSRSEGLDELRRVLRDIGRGAGHDSPEPEEPDS
jgi:hypothetical protein